MVIFDEETERMVSYQSHQEFSISDAGVLEQNGQVNELIANEGYSTIKDTYNAKKSQAEESSITKRNVSSTVSLKFDEPDDEISNCKLPPIKINFDATENNMT